MSEQKIVVLFGDSLLMDTVEASLSECQEIGLMRIHTTVPNIGDRLKSIDPHLVIFDWDASHCQFVLSFLRDQPGIPLLGLDVTCSKAILICSQQYTVYTALELIQLIRLQTSGVTMGNEANSMLLT